MNNSKLVEILGALSSHELTRLGRFLQSPYYQASPLPDDEWRLFDLLRNQLLGDQEPNWDKEAVFAEVFPDMAFVKGKLEKKMSALFKQVQRFIIQEQIHRNQSSFEESMALAQFYRGKNLLRLYHITFAALQKAHAKVSRRDKSFYYNEFQVFLEIAEFKSLQNNRNEDLSLPATLNSLDVYYLVTKLEYAYGLLSLREFQTPIDARESLELLESVTQHLENSSYLKVPLIETYHTAILVLQDTEDESAFNRLRQLLDEHRNTIPHIDEKALRALCRNYCVHRFNRGEQAYLEMAYNFYREDLERGLLYYNDGLTPGLMRNVAAIGLKQKQYDWVLNFLQNHRQRILGVENPEEIYQFNLAHYYFELKDYDMTLQSLSAHYPDLYYRIAAKRLEIKVYYEQSSILLEPKMDAFKVFIHRLSRTKLRHTHREGNNNFINALRQIITPGLFKNDKRIERVTKKIREQEVIIDKDWLLEKLQEQLTNSRRKI